MKSGSLFYQLCRLCSWFLFLTLAIFAIYSALNLSGYDFSKIGCTVPYFFAPQCETVLIQKTLETTFQVWFLLPTMLMVLIKSIFNGTLGQTFLTPTLTALAIGEFFLLLLGILFPVLKIKKWLTRSKTKPFD